MKKLTAVLFLSLLFTLSSCENDRSGITDFTLQHVVLTSLTVSPAGFNTDTIFVNGTISPNDIVTLTVETSVRAVTAVGITAPTDVDCRVAWPGESRALTIGRLFDNGSGPDSVAGDGIYSGSLTFRIPRVEVGNLILEASLSDQNSPSSNSLAKQISIVRQSRAPVLTNLQAPDSVALPPSGSVTLILLTIQVADSDGTDDIVEVFFRNLNGNDPARKFLLLDDGNVNGLSGDSVMNDGVYSSLVILTPENTPGINQLEFLATDRLDLQSNSIIHPIIVYRP